MCGYDYMKKNILRRADLNEHIIAEQDFKYLYPSDFKDLYLLILQGHLNHLPPKDKKILTTAPLKEDRPTTSKLAWSIPSFDLHVLKNNWASALASTYSPPQEDSLLAHTGDMAMFIDWFCKRQGITELRPQDLEGPAFELVKVFHPNLIHLQYQMEECHKLVTDSVDDSIIRHNVSKPLPLGGSPAAATVEIPASLCRISKNLFDRVSHMCYPFSNQSVSKQTEHGDFHLHLCEEASKVESCPSEIILDDLLALDSIVRFDFE
nr:hypothetical protein [Tanacetum cinerariifolium]